jgi:choline dehydrogenase
VSTSMNVHANHYSGGRIVGGSSATNDGIWWKGQDSTYAAAGGIFANTTYLNQVFKSLETFNGITPNPLARGSSGPLNVVTGPSVNGTVNANTAIATRFTQAVINAYNFLHGLAIPLVSDFNVVQGSFTSKTGDSTLNPTTLERESAATAFLSTSVGQQIDIRKNAQVLRVEFADDSTGAKYARSVSYLQNGEVKQLAARKKIILCTGHNTPAVLMHSGIGDRAYLDPLAIPVVYHSPDVGRNMKNHVNLQFLMTANSSHTAEIFAFSNAFKQITGVASVPEVGNPTSQGRDFQLAIIAGAPGIIVPVLVLTNAQSTGNVYIVDKDPLVPACVDLGYTSDPRDFQSLLYGVGIVKEVARQLNILDPTYNLISNLANPTAFIKANLAAFHHWHGQTKIGSVVDQELNVIGVKNLMVADLTVFPLTDGNTQAMGYAVGAAAYSLLTKNYNVSF